MGEQVFTKSSITVATAVEMLQAGFGRAEELGKPMALTVVDESGVLKAFARMDGAPLVAVQVSQDKAYSALQMKRPTDAWQEVFERDTPLAQGVPTGIDRMVVFGGGYPIVIDGECVGGIGVSGAHYTEDMQVAEAALAVLAG